MIAELQTSGIGRSKTSPTKASETLAFSLAKIILVINGCDRVSWHRDQQNTETLWAGRIMCPGTAHCH